MELFDNPMVNSAKKAMTQEQIEEYKRIGEYMYNNKHLAQIETGQKREPPTNSELAFYAYEFVKAGGNPKDLSDVELNALSQIKGREWYKEFGFSESDIPKPMVETLDEKEMQKLLETKEGLEKIENHLKTMKLSRTERRAIERKIAKQKARLEKAK